MNSRNFHIVVALIVSIIALMACSTPIATVQPVALVATNTPIPTSTKTRTPSDTQTATSIPTVTFTPTPSPTFTSSPIPTPIGGAYGILFQYNGKDRLSSKKLIISPDGSIISQLPFIEGRDWLLWGEPSPDGRFILVAKILDSRYSELYVMNIDGTNQIKLTDKLINLESDGSSYNQPIWLSDGRLVFLAEKFGESYIFVINQDGTGLRQITQTGSYPYWLVHANDEKVYWFSTSPINGTKTGYYWTMLDGSEQSLITEWDSIFENYVRTVKFSPDDSHIAFQMDPIGQDTRYIFYTDINGSNGQKIDIKATYFSWSPDGTKLFLQSESEISPNTYINSIWDLSGFIDVLPNTLGVGRPTWSPDGKLVLFQHGCCGHPLEILNLETKEVIQLPLDIDWEEVLSSLVYWIPLGE